MYEHANLPLSAWCPFRFVRKRQQYPAFQKQLCFWSGVSFCRYVACLLRWLIKFWAKIQKNYETAAMLINCRKLALWGGGWAWVRLASKLFCKLWLVRWIMRFANVLAVCRENWIKMCGGENKKYRSLGIEYRFTRCPVEIWSVCCSFVKIVRQLLSVQFGRPTLVHNDCIYAHLRLFFV